MSVQLPIVNLSGAVVGSAGNIPLGQAIPPPTIDQQMRPAQLVGATLFIFNESGCGLTMLFPLSRETFTVAAGAWKQVAVPPGEVDLDYLVIYLIPNAPVTQLIVDLYLPGEPIDSVGILGNSPIGLSGTVQTGVTQVIQDGQPNGQTIVEATPTGQPQNVLITTDGNATFLGRLLLGNGLQFGGGTFSGTVPALRYNAAASLMDFYTPQAGGASQEMAFVTWDGAVSRVAFGIGTNNPAGALISVSHLGALQKIAGQATAGSFGVPVIVAAAQGVSITNTSATQIASVTVPNDGKNHMVRCWADFDVGAGNTNNGTVSLWIDYTDPLGGVLTGQPFNHFSSGSVIALAVVTIVKLSTYDGLVYPRFVTTTPGSTVSVWYQNQAAGTISDHASAVIELLS